jgi:hypothetical protein
VLPQKVLAGSWDPSQMMKMSIAIVGCVGIKKWSQ